MNTKHKTEAYIGYDFDLAFTCNS